MSCNLPSVYTNFEIAAKPLYHICVCIYTLKLLASKHSHTYQNMLCTDSDNNHCLRVLLYFMPQMHENEFVSFFVCNYQLFQAEVVYFKCLFSLSHVSQICGKVFW